MTEFSFANGIKIHFPNHISKEELLTRWTETKFIISVLLMEHPKVEPKIKKPYNMNLRAEAIKRRTKSWRNSKKPGLFLK